MIPSLYYKNQKTELKKGKNISKEESVKHFFNQDVTCAEELPDVTVSIQYSDSLNASVLPTPGMSIRLILQRDYSWAFSNK